MPTASKARDLLDLEKELSRATWLSFSATTTDASESGTPARLGIPTPPPSASATESDATASAAAAPIRTENSSVFPDISLTQNDDRSTLDSLPTFKLMDYKIRMLHFARAAIFALDYQNPALSSDEIAAKKTLIERQVQNFLGHLDALAATPKGNKQLRSACNAFFMLLAQTIQSPTQSYKQAEKQLLEAENILTWQQGRPKQTNVSFITVAGKKLKIERSEEAVTRLTTAQRLEFLARKQEAERGQTKGWFKALSPMLQAYLIKHIPNSVDGDWSVIERTIPATLRRVPGLANFTHSTTIITDITDAANPVVLNRSSMYRSATATPIDLKGRRYAGERQRLAQQNIEQYLQVVVEKRLDEFLKVHGLSTADDVTEKLARVDTYLKGNKQRLKLSLPVNSLLNELFAETLLPHGENNTRFMAELRQAIANIKKEYEQKYPHITFDLYATSTPINDCRYLLITTNADGRADDQRYIQYCEERLSAIAESLKTHAEDPQLIAEQKLLTAAKKALADIQGRQDYFGDLGLIRAALYEIIIPDSISACKSGKDRLIYKQDYAAALRIYYAAHGHFPDFSLPKKLPRAANALAYAGLIIAGLATAAIFLTGTLFPPLAITILIGIAAASAAMSLGIGTFALFRKNPNFNTRFEFLKIVRHLRLTGFGALSANFNAPGVYGQKNSDIAPDDLSRARLAQFPFRDKKQWIDLGVYLLGAGGSATATYFLITSLLILPTPAVAALPIFLAVIVAVPLITYVASKLIQYAATPKLKDAAEKAVRKAFASSLREEHEIAKGNKYKGKSTQAQVEAVRLLTHTSDDSARFASVSSASVSAGGVGGEPRISGPSSGGASLVAPPPPAKLSGVATDDTPAPGAQSHQ